MNNKVTDWETLAKQDPRVEQVITPEMAKMMFANSDYTIKVLEKGWLENGLKNAKLWKRHCSFRKAFEGFGINKAVIAVGAGPSYNLNKDVLRGIYHYNTQFPINEQPFIIIATNKVFKTMLKDRIYPHFVVLIDAGDALYPQLCEDIPEEARDIPLLTGLHVSPKILQAWHKQGGHVYFYVIGSESDVKQLSKKAKDDVKPAHIEQGGNVMNTLFILCGQVLGSTAHIVVGNDLAFKYSKDYEERKKAFYADGDYRFSILNKRDDAKQQLAWMGFANMRESVIQKGAWLYDMEVMSTSHLLWIYKTWMEVQVAMWAEKKTFQYFNCSESGILGVLARDGQGQALMQKDNWFLMDELFPKRWLTRSLESTANNFIMAWEIWKCEKAKASGEILTTASSVNPWQAKTGIVKTIGPPSGNILYQ